MAVGEILLPEMHRVEGVEWGTACAGIKQTQRDDLAILRAAENSTCAAVFTRNAFCAAPVHLARANLERAPRWFLINSGNANAGTGARGMQDAEATCAALAAMVEDDAQRVLPFSTGVIGEPLPTAKITAALPTAVGRLSENNWADAARAIMTTDTAPKGASVKVLVAGESVTVTGIAKGAGMIQPDMATLLAFIATDAHIERPLLQRCLDQAVAQSFNRITVDGDTSTNDACVLIASACSKAPKIEQHDDGYRVFAEAVTLVCKRLAEAIVRDGEGATKLMRIVVDGALNEEEAVRVGKTIAHSPLVKTAFFACDPNWGRILAAVGRAGVVGMDLDKVDIYLDGVCIVRNGARASDYTEEAGQRVMAAAEITINVALGRGDAVAEVLTCDLSYDYVKINAEYRT
ncbi:MAG: bifunctional glutamate N-acetyltransferase/amino-acid acetyltransferase ArgJ [Gammaproteobacteria bacterium]